MSEPTPHCPVSVIKDPILGLIQVFKEDARREKIDLLAGVLKKQGAVTFLDSVKRAQSLFLEGQKEKNYLPMRGNAQACSLIGSLIWKKAPPLSIQSLGGTGALSLACQLALAMGYRKALISEPSWPNHSRIVQQAGLVRLGYTHLENRAFSSLVEVLKSQSEPVVLLLQPFCHNPTGVDFTFEECQELFSICEKNRHLVLFDVAYMGFKWGLEEDGAYLDKLTNHCSNWLLSFSCSKNMTLYAERVGVLFGRLFEHIELSSVQDYLSHLARASYSNPPLHGIGVAQTLLSHDELKSFWIKELKQEYRGLQEQRNLLSQSFKKAGFHQWASSIENQSGLFGYFPLSCEKADLLKEASALYLPLEGRVNLTSLSPVICEKLIEGLQLVGVGE